MPPNHFSKYQNLPLYFLIMLNFKPVFSGNTIYIPCVFDIILKAYKVLTPKVQIFENVCIALVPVFKH